MGSFGSIATLIILALSAFGALLLEKNVHTGYEASLLAIVLIIILGLTAIIGIGMNAKWAWALMLLVLSASLANLLWLLLVIGRSITLWGTMAVTIFGVLIASIAVETPRVSVPAAPAKLETYSNGNSEMMTEKPAKKRKSKRK